jgi:hypothetical protein
LFEHSFVVEFPESVTAQNPGIIEQHVNFTVADGCLEPGHVSALADVDACQYLGASRIEFLAGLPADGKDYFASGRELAHEFEPDAAIAACY